MCKHFFTINFIVALVKPYKIPGPTRADAGSMLIRSD